MTETTPVGIGLHICQSIDKHHQGVGCDKTFYSPNDLIFLHVLLKGRPSSVKDRVVNLVVNNVIADSVTLDRFTEEFLHVWTLDETYTGNLRVDYVENGLRYWTRAFERGMCVLPYDINRITSERLISNIIKMRS